MDITYLIVLGFLLVGILLEIIVIWKNYINKN